MMLALRSTSRLHFPRVIQDACDEAKQLFECVKSHRPVRRDVLDAAFEASGLNMGFRPKLYDERLFVLCIRSSCVEKGHPSEINGDRLRKRRLDLGHLQREVAMQIGVTKCTIQYWETDRVAPSLRFIPRITLFLDEESSGSRCEAIRAQRIRLGLTREELAARLGIVRALLHVEFYSQPPARYRSIWLSAEGRDIAVLEISKHVILAWRQVHRL